MTSSDTDTDGEKGDVAGKIQKIARTSTARGTHRQGRALSQAYISPSARPDIIVRKGYRVVLDKAAIRETSADYKSYSVAGTELHHLPIYDDCSQYGILESQFDVLLRKEVDKLVTFARQDAPPLFASGDCFHGTGLKDFEDLSSVADQINCNFAILAHDNSRHGLEIETIASEAWDILIESRRKLKARYSLRQESHVVGRHPVLLEPGRNRMLYHYLTDYMLGILAWWFVRCAESKFWKTHLLSTLARTAVKLKIVAENPVESATRSLEETQATLKRLKTEAEFNETIVKIGGKERDIDLFTTENDMSNLYYEDKMLLRDHIHTIVHHMLSSLMKRERSGTDADSFEICTLIYRTGLDGITSMMTAQRDGDVVASSNLQDINFCYSIVNLLKHNSHELQKLDRSSSPVASNPLAVAWGCSDGAIGEESRQFLVHQMDHAISLLVPLALMNPTCARQVACMKSLTNVLADEDDLIKQFEPPPQKFALEYTLSTKPWAGRLLKQCTGMFDPTVQNFSKSPLLRGVADLSCIVPGPSSHSPTSGEISRLLKEYEAEKHKTADWEIMADSISVPCTTYTKAVQLLTGVVVLGGLVSGFTVGGRLHGVDPFQIATYSWLLGGFILIVAKSRFVSSWPWHDFLRGRVVCRTVSDLSDVSRIKPQVVLLYLLHNEWNSRLITQGPYNGMFRRKSDSRDETSSGQNAQSKQPPLHAGAFSIDTPVELITMFASGFVVLKALNAVGEHLICIDGRKGGWDAARRGRSGNWMTCPNFNTDALEGVRGSEVDQEELKSRIHMLRRVSFQWTKILGVYVQGSRFG